MFSVYIIDNSPGLPESFLKKFPWQSNGFEICGCSRNPTLALAEVLSLKPHVVVCDPETANMDGIAFMREIRKRSLECEFIMASAHASFSDAREFFLSNGFDYLLKPLNVSEMEIVLKKLFKKLMWKYGNVKHTKGPFRASSPRIDEIISYISRNYNKKITLDMLSKEFNLNSNYVCNLFSKHYGQTFTVFITNLRMKEAGRKIAYTDKPLKMIAGECGYSNYAYFSKVFKLYYNIPPNLYAARNRAGNYLLKDSI